MGVYDILPKGSQVKCWGSKMRHLDVGDKVGNIVGEKNYIVILREGGYVKVIKKKINKIVENGVKYLIIEIEPLPIFDKYGDRMDHTDGYKSPFGDDYYY